MTIEIEKGNKKGISLSLSLFLLYTIVYQTEPNGIM
jgi:hypothetical protein